MTNRIIEIQTRLQQKYPPEDGLSRQITAMSNRSLDIRYDVPLVPQQTGMSCWAAGAAMIVAWREGYSVDPQQIAQGSGEWAAYTKGLHPESTSIFPVWGLTPESPQSYSVSAFANLLATYGPLWVAGAVPGPHVRVVTGLYGDGTPDGTYVLVNDPWQKGMNLFSLPNAGAQYSQTYRQFIAESERLALKEATQFPKAIYVARSSAPLTNRSQTQRLGARSFPADPRKPFTLATSFSSRALAWPISYDAPRAVPAIRQATSNTGWAAAAAMLVSYREGSLVSPEEVVRRAGGGYSKMLQNDSAMPRLEAGAFLAGLGLASEPATQLTVEQLHNLLRRSGVVWLTPDHETVFAPDSSIVTGLHGDGTAVGTVATVLDPRKEGEVKTNFDSLLGLYHHVGGAELPNRMLAIYWFPDTLGKVQPSENTQINGLPLQQQLSWSRAQNPVALGEAIQIGLAAISVVQAQAAASQGSFVLTYDKAQRLLSSEARVKMPNSQATKQGFRRPLLFLGSGKVGAAYAQLIIEWEGNPYGEISTPVIRRDLSNSTEWSHSGAQIAITVIDRIPLPNTDPRAWPITYSYEGTYNPFGNGYFEFSGEFEVNAFGGLRFTRHEVVSRALVEAAVLGAPEDFVVRGADVVVPVPKMPQEQAAYFSSKMP